MIRFLEEAGFKPASTGRPPRWTNRPNQPNGFTLIEVIIFIVLIGIIMAGIISPFLNSVVRSEKPEIVASAAFLAQERLEQLQTATYNSIANEASVALTGNYSAFSRQVTVTLLDANLNGSGSDVGYKKVVVTVYHSQLPAAGISVTSLFTNYAG